MRVMMTVYCEGEYVKEVNAKLWAFLEKMKREHPAWSVDSDQGWELVKEEQR